MNKLKKWTSFRCWLKTSLVASLLPVLVIAIPILISAPHPFWSWRTVVICLVQYMAGMVYCVWIGLQQYNIARLSQPPKG